MSQEVIPLTQDSEVDGVSRVSETEQAVDEIQRSKPYQKYLDASLGLRNHWYPIFFGRELSEGEVRGEMLLGERILYKRIKGRIYAVEDRCPHRGVCFSARPESYSQNTITCWFHGWTFDLRDGKLIQIITEPGSKIIGKVSVKPYPVEEINGVVFTFVDDMNIWFADVEGTRVVAANVDPDNPPKTFEIEVGLFMPCGLQVDFFPAPGMIHFEWYTPVDEDHHMYMITQSAVVENDEQEKK